MWYRINLFAERSPLLLALYDIIFTKAVLKAVAIFAVEETDPFQLLSEIFQYTVIFLREYPHRAISMSSAKSELRQHVLFLRHGSFCRTVIDYEES